jgi:hypothetical protein
VWRWRNRGHRNPRRSINRARSLVIVAR